MGAIPTLMLAAACASGPRTWHGITARDAGAPRFVDLDPGLLPRDVAEAGATPKLFAVRLATGEAGVVDPRRIDAAPDLVRLRAARPDAWQRVGPIIVERLSGLAGQGLSGVVLRETHRFGPDFLGAFAEAVRRAGLALLVEADAIDDAQLAVVRGKADGLLIRRAGHAVGDLVARRERLRTIAPVWFEADGATADDPALALADGLLLRDGPDPVPAPLAEHVRSLSAYRGEARTASAAGAVVTAVLRADAGDLRYAGKALLLLANRTRESVVPDVEVGPFRPVEGMLSAPLAPGELRLLAVQRTARVAAIAPVADAETAAAGPRLVLEGIQPHVEGGAFPVKRIVGETVTVDALLYGDGHEQLACEIQWRAQDSRAWQRIRMAQRPNDGWRGAFRLDRLGRYEFIVEGWLDRFGGFRRDFRKKRDAGVAIAVDYSEGRQLAEQALARADRAGQATIRDWLDRYDAAASDDARADLLLAPDIAAAMDAADDRPHRVRSDTVLLDAERIEARFSSWYELFPRSQTDDKARHGTFADVIERLPAIRAMGFDTLYFPPIHPIGKTNRKGPNNTLTPEPHDVGSPYAIGSPDGGHDALHPELGSFADFEALVAAARDEGLEIAIDFAIQCSPDHPWLKDHPGWFDWRPDGSIKYAENPPKKYQDIVNVDFYAEDAVPGLWIALRDVVLLWISHGVTTFRVDNPHTKPLPFWEWMIGAVRAAHPEAIFLAEAFTRPTMMYRLAKVGFSQSYTYFTWRNGKQELTDYLTELTTTAPKEFYRPHFFVNTPDINPPYLQTSGRAGFRVRAVLAATLSGLFGVYSGFELCESAPIPGKEEYLDSEKYEIRPRDWQAPGNIIADITLLNRLRRTYPALQTHLNTRFYTADNDAILAYGKPAPDGSDLILVLVNLDPHQAQEAHFEVPLWEFGLPDDGRVAVEDLAASHRFEWHGKDQWIRLSPDQPYRIWRIWSVA